MNCDAVLTPIKKSKEPQNSTPGGAHTTILLLARIVQYMNMAPRLESWQVELIHDMINSTEPFTNSQIAKARGCTPPSIRTIQSNIRCFASIRAPANSIGRRQSITPLMLEALCEHLLEKPHLYQDEMVVFLWDEFRVLVSTYSIGGALASIGWTKKAARLIAKERNADLRGFYIHTISSFSSYHMVYVDESGYDKRARFRRTDWSSLGVTPVQMSRFRVMRPPLGCR